MLTTETILLNQESEHKDAAIKRCGEMLQKGGYASAEYTEGMLARDNNFSTAIGNLIAIPHGEKEYKQYIQKTGICVITYPDGIDWNGTPVKLVVGIAALGEEHLEILENIVDVLEEEEDVIALVEQNSKEKIIELFTGGKA